MTLPEKYEVAPVNLNTARKWFQKKHYAKRIPASSYIFGLIEKDSRLLKGIVSFGMPASPSVAPSIAGEEYTPKVLELNRLILQENNKNEASFFIASAIKLMPHPIIIISYSDTDMGHVGIIYQSLNFLYCGLTEERIEKKLVRLGSAHSRHNKMKHRIGDEEIFLEKRSAKHRYILIYSDKRFKKNFMSKLKYKILPYPKAAKTNYDSGEEIKRIIPEQYRIF